MWPTKKEKKKEEKQAEAELCLAQKRLIRPAKLDVPIMKLRTSSICQQIDVVFYLSSNLGCVPFTFKLRLFSIFLKLRSSSIYLTIEVIFQFSYNSGRLPFCQNIEVVFHSAIN